jgi:hypothetical protein
MLPVIEYRIKQEQQKKQEVIYQDYTKILLNYKHKNGRIYASTGSSDDNYIAVSVSPYHPKFDTQIEDGIKDIVISLIEKNYLTLSSCEGHDDGWNSMMVKLAFVDEEDRDKFIDHFKHIKNLSFKLDSKASNVRLFFQNQKLKMERTEPIEDERQTNGINDLYFRKYKRYCFLDVYFFKYKDGIFNFFSRYYTKYKKKKFLNQTKKEVLEVIRKIPQYEK